MGVVTIASLHLLEQLSEIGWVHSLSKIVDFLNLLDIPLTNNNLRTITLIIIFCLNGEAFKNAGVLEGTEDKVVVLSRILFNLHISWEVMIGFSHVMDDYVTVLDPLLDHINFTTNLVLSALVIQETPSSFAHWIEHWECDDDSRCSWHLWDLLTFDMNARKEQKSNSYSIDLWVNMTVS